MNETERIERESIARLFAGELDRACYRKEVEALTTRGSQPNNDLQ